MKTIIGLDGYGAKTEPTNKQLYIKRLGLVLHIKQANMYFEVADIINVN